MNNSTQSSLKDFEIIEEIGKGAFGFVYKAKRIKDGQIYALKKVVMNKLKLKEKENTLNEIRILASISHPHVISYREAFYDDASSSICIVMEFADNGDLEKKIERSLKNKTFLQENEILSILKSIVLGLKALHDKKIMHRDIKAANIFLFQNDVVKIGDLNVSKVVKMSMIHTQTGTPYYASPEVWNDKPYDYKSDIWSLGCLLYEMTALKAPFRGTTMKSVYEKVIKGNYEPLPSFYSKFLNNLISVMLQSKPFNRPNCEQILHFIDSKQISFEKTKRLQSAGKVENNFGSNYNYKIPYDINLNTEESKLNEKLLKTIKIPKKLIELNIMLPKNKYNNCNKSFELVNKNKLDRRQDYSISEINKSVIKESNKNLANVNVGNYKLDQSNLKNDIPCPNEKFVENFINKLDDFKSPNFTEGNNDSNLIEERKKKENKIKNNNYHFQILNNYKNDDSVLKMIQKPILIKNNILYRGRESPKNLVKIHSTNQSLEEKQNENDKEKLYKLNLKIHRAKDFVPLNKNILSIKDNYNSFNKDFNKKKTLETSMIEEKIKQMKIDQQSILQMKNDSIELPPTIPINRAISPSNCVPISQAIPPFGPLIRHDRNNSTNIKRLLNNDLSLSPAIRKLDYSNIQNPSQNMSKDGVSLPSIAVNRKENRILNLFNNKSYKNIMQNNDMRRRIKSGHIQSKKDINQMDVTNKN